MIARAFPDPAAQPAICIDYASNFHRFQGHPRIGYTVFEFTRLTSDWLSGLRSVDQVWTTSHWGKGVLERNGIDGCRVRVVPEGVDPLVFYQQPRRPRSGPFRFLTVGKWEVRKGQAELLQAWANAFGNQDDVELVMMCDNPFVPGFSPEAEIHRLGFGALANIHCMKPLKTDHDMAACYGDADCFVLPTRAEGWGLPIMEAMACGLPVITTRYSAMTDYVTDELGYLLDVKRMVPVHDPLFFPQTGLAGEWADIDIDQLTHMLRTVYLEPSGAAAKGIKAASEVAQRWTWDHAARIAMAVLSGPNEEPTTAMGSRAVSPPAANDLAHHLAEGDRSPVVLKKASISDVMGAADALTAGGQVDPAITLYESWLAHTDSPLAFVARFNLARLFGDRNDLQAAESHYRQAIAAHADFPQARLNLGSILERQGRPAEAIATWEAALADLEKKVPPDPSLLKHALNNMGRLFEQQHRYPDAEIALTRSLAVDPTQDEVLHHWVHLRQKQCEWPVYDPLPGISVERMVAATSALAMLSASDDPALQLRTARAFVDAKIPKGLPRLAPVQGYAHDRLRIGYLSSNLNLHAVTILTAEVYELHDRNRFEVYGFCWSPEDGTQMRQRIRQSMDHLVRIDQMSDEGSAQAIRDAEIDILVDLQGLTSGCRPVILAYKPAPVQISWLGFPGTSGLPGVDYILADRYLIPEDRVHFYSEKPIYLPDCFQANDRQRQIGPTPTRARYQLPDDGFVFCAFNHNHKFTPEVFGAWMRILLAVSGSVLWLLADNDSAKRNLIKFAVNAGVDSQRLIFAPREQPVDYMARYQIADLFLDTLPFNGGTTTSDALWAGLPVLTCSGRAFAARMAGSLLNAIGLPELVTTNLADYESVAIALGRDRNRLSEIRNHLQQNRLTHPLFDTPRLLRALESALFSVAKRSSLTVSPVDQLPLRDHG